MECVSILSPHAVFFSGKNCPIALLPGGHKDRIDPVRPPTTTYQSTTPSDSVVGR